jgi:hypothetical protein
MFPDDRWEAQQLIASGVLKVKDYPTFDDPECALNVPSMCGERSLTTGGKRNS